MDEALWRRLCDRRWREIRESSGGEARVLPQFVWKFVLTYFVYQNHKKLRKSWREVFAYRMKVDDNWNRGKVSRVFTLRGHESQVSRLLL
jgi:hypothetical protein